MTPRAPWWMPQPNPDEKFVDFWERMGLEVSTIARSLMTLKGAEDVANDRLAHTYSLRNRVLYQRKRDAWLASFGYSVG